MKLFIITLVLSLTFSFNSLAQDSNEDFSNMTFGASAKKTTATKKAASTVTYEIGRYETAGDYQLFIPKSFSPNNDGVNDVFEVQSKNVLDFEMIIFDQWGGFVLETKDILQKWDGSLSGKELRKGAYVYVIKVKTVTGQSFKYSGCLMIED
jgi:gliding motility-associated-like protein